MMSSDARAVRFEGELPQAGRWCDNEHADIIEEVLGGHLIFIDSGSICDGVPIYVLEAMDPSVEIVLYRVPSGMGAPSGVGDISGTFWVIQRSHSFLAYGIDHRVSDERVDPCFYEPDPGCAWYIGDYTNMRETDVQVPDVSIINMLPAQRATRAVLQHSSTVFV